MEHAFGLEISRMLEQVCRPDRLARVVNDRQVGIVNQLRDGAAVSRRCLDIWARNACRRLLSGRRSSMRLAILLWSLLLATESHAQDVQWWSEVDVTAGV
jgi:hypothetical protein